MLTIFIIYLRVCEEKDSMFVLNAGHGVQLLKVVVEGGVVIASTQLNLETLVAVDMSSQSVDRKDVLHTLLTITTVSGWFSR